MSLKGAHGRRVTMLHGHIKPIHSNEYQSDECFVHILIKDSAQSETYVGDGFKYLSNGGHGHLLVMFMRIFRQSLKLLSPHSVQSIL